ncbi:hypothetical protein JCM11251_002655 [Rhodosporidiobolus azoricus]
MDTLFCLRSPPVDNTTQKALRLPIVNPIDRHGRIFFFAWLSFLLSFLSWYSMPPLLNQTIKNDLNLTDAEVQNSNIIAGVASLIVRLIAGPLCDRFGPRYVLVAALWLSAIPCGAAGTAHNAMGLYFVRFFMGIAGAVFVPCQVLMAAWFDKKVIGTASAFAAGWGDAGVGVTFFVMPAVFNSFSSAHDHPTGVAWRLSFLVPCVLLLACGLAVLLLNDDTPTGSWATRHIHQPRRGSTEPLNSVNSSTTVLDRPIRSPPAAASPAGKGKSPSGNGHIDVEKAQGFASEVRRGSADSAFSSDPPPSAAPATQPFTSQLKDLTCIPTLMLAATYFATFGIALVVNSVLVTWYMEKFAWDQNTAGNWTALFGLLNIVARPFGGVMADCWYRRFGEGRGLLAKKFWMSVLCTVGGVFALLVGLINLDTPAGLIALVSMVALFVEAGNGATFALLPHVNPHINGLMGGIVGASGNLGGIVFSTVNRYSTIPQTIWVAGIVGVAVGLAIAIPHPVPRNKRALYQAPTGQTC